MTNQLFREVLDGRIPLPAKPKPRMYIDTLLPWQQAFLRSLLEPRKHPTTGPTPAPLRHRGRINRYRTKG